jgi:hypothetical protein
MKQDKKEFYVAIIGNPLTYYREYKLYCEKVYLRTAKMNTVHVILMDVYDVIYEKIR